MYVYTCYIRHIIIPCLYAETVHLSYCWLCTLFFVFITWNKYCLHISSSRTGVVWCIGLLCPTCNVITILSLCLQYTCYYKMPCHWDKDNQINRKWRMKLMMLEILIVIWYAKLCTQCLFFYWERTGYDMDQNRKKLAVSVFITSMNMGT